MRTLIVCCLFLPMLCLAQKKNKGYCSFDASIDVKKNYDPPIGIRFSGNGEIVNGFFLGAEVGVVKFPDLEGVYVPILARFTVVPNADSKKTTFLALLEPGYGAYNKQDALNAPLQGGFNFFGGIGATFSGKGSGRMYLAAGYSLYGFKRNDIKSDREMLGMRVGIMFW